MTDLCMCIAFSQSLTRKCDFRTDNTVDLVQLILKSMDSDLEKEKKKM